jgi:hypothetical protein
MTTDFRKPTAADFMRIELEDEEKNRIRRLNIERLSLFLQGKYELEEGEILEAFEYEEAQELICAFS